MYNLLIADRSDDLCAMLVKQFRKEFHVTVCHDGITAEELLHTLQLDALILDLSLPYGGGQAMLLKNRDVLPYAVLVLSDYCNPHLQQSVADCGGKQLLMRPFRTDAAYMHIMQMLQFSQNADSLPQDSYTTIGLHLDALQIPADKDGYNQLRMCILYYIQDPGQRLTKELYPAVANLLGASDGRSVERSTRTAIDTAWKTGNAEVWQKYFPNLTKSPSNKHFIAQIAKYINKPPYQSESSK